MEKTNKERVLYYDVLNILACFCVIWLHCNGIVHTYTHDRAWTTSLIVETIAYWAVPVFFMLTGATLMNYRKKYSTKTFFKKRILKTVIPFFIWSMIIIVWKYYTNRLVINDFSVRSILNIIFNNKQETVYWFFWALFAVYISMPVLSLLTEPKHRKTLWYLAVVSAIFNSIPLISKITKINWNGAFNFPIACGYIGYVVLGYLISTQDISKRKRYIIYFLGIISLLIRYFATYFLSKRDGVINKLLFGYLYFTALFLALAVFVFIKNINLNKIFRTEKTAKIISRISSCSFGIYLIHQIVMTYEIKFLSINTRSWEWRTIGAICTYIICLGIVYVIKKIPILKRIVP